MSMDEVKSMAANAHHSPEIRQEEDVIMNRSQSKMIKIRPLSSLSKQSQTALFNSKDNLVNKRYLYECKRSKKMCKV